MPCAECGNLYLTPNINYPIINYPIYLTPNINYPINNPKYKLSHSAQGICARIYSLLLVIYPGGPTPKELMHMHELCHTYKYNVMHTKIIACIELCHTYKYNVIHIRIYI